MFLLDDLVMTTQQQANLNFLVRLGKSSSEALYASTSLQRADVSFNSF